MFLFNLNTLIRNKSEQKLIYTTITLGYVFWTLYQALPAMIWFYPLNELEITGKISSLRLNSSSFLFASTREKESTTKFLCGAHNLIGIFPGYEAFAVVYLSPIILSVGAVRRVFQTRWVLALCRFLMVASLASFQVCLLALLRQVSELNGHFQHKYIEYIK